MRIRVHNDLAGAAAKQNAYAGANAADFEEEAGKLVARLGDQPCGGEPEENSGGDIENGEADRIDPIVPTHGEKMVDDSVHL